MARSTGDDRFSITFGHGDTCKHWGGVYAMSMCAATNNLYTGSRDCRIKCWAAGIGPSETPRYLRTLNGHTGWITSLVTTPSLVISASYDTTVRLWSAEDGRHLHTIAGVHTDYVLRLVHAPHSQQFLSAGLKGHLHMWDLEKCTQLANMQTYDDLALRSDSGSTHVWGGQVTTGSIYAIHSTPDAGLIVYNGPDGSICLVDKRDRPSSFQTLSGHSDNVRDLRLSKDGQRLVSVSSDRSMRLWDMRQTGSCLRAFYMHTDSVWAVEADDAVEHVLSGGRDGKLFVTDVNAARTSLICDVGEHIVSLCTDPWRAAVWVSTPSSSVTAWSIPDARPSEPVRSEDSAALSQASGLVRSSTSRLEAQQVLDYKPLVAQPVLCLPGIPPLVRFAVFDDRRHVLTKDTTGAMRIWDIVYCKHVRQLKKGPTFEAYFKKLFVDFLVTVPPWFTCDVNQGVLTLHLAKHSCFSAEIYARSLGLEVGDDFKWNMGHMMLRAVLEVLRVKAMGRSDLGEFVSKQGPFAFYDDKDVWPIVSSSYSGSSLRWRIPMRQFAGTELQAGMLPQWVVEAVMQGRIGVQQKVAFSIEPMDSALMNTLGRERLTAPVILEIHKVAQYVQSKLMPHRTSLQPPLLAPMITFDAEENRRRAMAQGNGDHLVVMHNGRMLPSTLSLNTVKRYLCTGLVDDDIPLQFGIVDWLNPPLLADVVPKDISL